MRRALISDIHGNREALDAVLDDIAGQRINEIFCLGDLVSYGPDPCECIDRVMENCRVTMILDDCPSEDISNGAGGDVIPLGSPRITYRRLAYDFETTIRKIKDIGSP